MKTVVFTFVYGLQIYLLLGLIIGLIVQPKGLAKIDPSVDGAGVWFRVITFFGVVALWPIVLIKWIRGAGTQI